MARSGGPGGPSQVPGWVLSANEVIERLFLMVRIHLCWCVLTLLGLVVLGLAPATAAAADALITSREGGRLRVLPVMWESWRRQFVGVNARMLPLLAVQAGALVTLWIVFSGAVASTATMVVLTSVAAASIGWATASLAAILASPRLRRQDLLVTWRLALLMPGALPVRTIVLLVLVAVWSLVSVLIVPLSVLVGSAAALDLTIGLLGRRVEEILAQIDRAQDDRAGGEQGHGDPA